MSVPPPHGVNRAVDRGVATDAPTTSATQSPGGLSGHPSGRPSGPPPNGRWLRSADPRTWQLWSLRHRVVLFLFAWETLTAAAVVWGTATTGSVTSTDWFRFAGLAACATAHVLITRKQDERRRSRRMMAVHIDLTGIWVFPAALLLPFPLTAILIAFIGGQRWFNWRRPPHRFFFTLCSSTLAAFNAHVVFVEISQGTLGQGLPYDPIVEFGVLVLAGLLYALTQMAGIGTVIALSSAHPRLRNVLGSKTDNLLDAATVGLGAINVVLLVHIPPAAVILVLVSVLGNRLAEISQLQEDAQTDAKTGLLNMRGWSEAAHRALARSARSGNGLALLMIDLDHFKWINDTYGHPAGDDVIAQVGALLTKAIRPSDVVGRFGGEEFVALLVDTDRVAAGHAAERIRHAVASMEIATTGRRGAPVTIIDRTTSIGIAAYPQHGHTVEELLHAADAAVYEAKERGRDQVRFAVGKPLSSDIPPIEARYP